MSLQFSIDTPKTIEGASKKSKKRQNEDSGQIYPEMIILGDDVDDEVKVVASSIPKQRKMASVPLQFKPNSREKENYEISCSVELIELRNSVLPKT